MFGFIPTSMLVCVCGSATNCVYFVQKIVCFWFYDGNGVLDAHREVSYDLNNVKKCLAQLNVQAEKRTTMFGHTRRYAALYFCLSLAWPALLEKWKLNNYPGRGWPAQCGCFFRECANCSVLCAFCSMRGVPCIFYGGKVAESQLT